MGDRVAKDKRRVTFIMPKTLWAKVEKMAKIQRLSCSQMMVRLIEDGIGNEEQFAKMLTVPGVRMALQDVFGSPEGLRALALGMESNSSLSAEQQGQLVIDFSRKMVENVKKTQTKKPKA